MTKKTETSAECLPVASRKMRAFWQGDPAWKLDDVGLGDNDMGPSGCLVTSITMASNWLLGKTETPKQINDKLKKVPSAWSGSNMVIPVAANALGLKAEASDRIRDKPASKVLQDALDEILSDPEQVAILHVATKPNDPMGRHFILAYAKTDGGYKVADPALGAVIEMPTSLSKEVMWRNVPKPYRVVSVIPVKARQPKNALVAL